MNRKRIKKTMLVLICADSMRKYIYFDVRFCTMLSKRTVRRMWEMMREQYKTYGRFNYKNIAKRLNINEHTVAKYGRVLYKQISLLQQQDNVKKEKPESPLAEFIKDLKANYKELKDG